MKTSNKIQHCLRICFRNCFIILSAVILVLFSVSQSFAGNVTFIKEYTYQASELDSKASCRTISLEMVKRLLLEELGTYLISETEVKDFKLTKEQVKTYSAGIVGAEIIEDKWDGKTYWLKAKVSADPKEVQKSLKKIIDDKYQAKQLEETRKKADELVKENERLREKLEISAKSKKHNTKAEALKVKEYEKTIKGLNAVEWINKGQTASSAGRYEEARDAYTKGIELKPDDALTYVGRGILWLRLANYQEAINDYNKAIVLEPKMAMAYANRGFAYAKIGNFQQAIEDSTKAIVLESEFENSYFYYSLMGEIYGMAGNYQQAIKNLDKAIDLNHSFGRAYFLRGLIYYKVENYQQAIENYTEAIKLNYNEAYVNRGVVYFNLNNYQQAIEDYTNAIKLNPADDKAYNNRGNAYDGLGDYQQAIKDYTKSIELKPDDAGTYYNRSRVYGKLRDYRAIEDIKIAARLGFKPARDFLREKGISW